MDMPRSTEKSSPRLRKFFRNHFVQWMFLVSIFVNVAMWSGIAWYIRPSEISIILRYNVYLSFDLNYVVSWSQAYIIPSVALLFLFINSIIAFFLFRKEDVFGAYIVLFANIGIQLAAAVASLAIIVVNT